MTHANDYADSVARGWLALEPNVDGLTVQAGLRLLRLGRLVERAIDGAAADHGLVVSGDYEVLATLRRSHPDPLQPATLAHRTMITTSGMTGRLDRLEAAGLVTRRPHPSDRRAIDISITRLGVKTADAVFHDIVVAETDLLSMLSREDLSRLSDLLRRVLSDLGDTLPDET